jgi:hypothetical protein
MEGMVAIEGRHGVMQASGVAVDGMTSRDASGDALYVSSHRSVLRFDRAALTGNSPIYRAVLSLSPHPSWRSFQRPVRVTVRSIRGGVGQEEGNYGEFPAAGEIVSTVTVPPDVRSTVRVDVTSVVQQWYARAHVLEGLMLETDTTESIVFVGLGSSSLLRRPHVEVVFR